MTTAVLLIAHGTVNSVSELPGFLRNIRRGHAPSDELLHEVTSRYAAIGGRSPLNDISARVATKLEAVLGMPVRYAARLWEPNAKDVGAQLVALGVSRVVVLPLAQYSAPLYVKHVQDAWEGLPLAVVGVGDWGQHDGLTTLYAKLLKETLAEQAEGAAGTRVLLTAHSLPKMLIDQGDPYEREFRASAQLVAKKADVSAEIVFQSQGMSAGPGGRPMVWLGPDVQTTLDRLKAEGAGHVTFAPMGFLADHVEVLYDLDIEARGWCEARGLGFARMQLPNDQPAFVAVLADLVRTALGSAPAAAGA
jgi:protoporphyrin/coproporphyrin ferrochelatase